MNNTTNNIELEIKSLLTSALPNENINDYDIEITGTSEKGTGYLSDIYFVNLISNSKNYNFVLKCGQSSEAFRKSAPIKETFDQEIYIYTTIVPTFREFEIKHNVCDVFDSIAKCYGTSTNQNREVIVLQNLKQLGYELWDKMLPLPRNYIETVLKEYGKWHAISTAMQDQQPKKFNELTSNLTNIMEKLNKCFNLSKVCISALENIVEIWKNDMDNDILNEWKKFGDQIEFYMANLRNRSKSLNVIIHGDCWNNNFMFKVTDNNKIKVSMLDWQASGLSSPVIDVSYFLYTCISGEDLRDFDDLLKIYYTSFSEHLRKLGSDPDKIYTHSNLLSDWKIYGRQGLIFLPVLLQVFSADKDDVPDLVQAAEDGKDVGSTFCTTIKNVDFIKQRSRAIIEHAVQRGLTQPIDDI